MFLALHDISDFRFFDFRTKNTFSFFERDVFVINKRVVPIMKRKVHTHLTAAVDIRHRKYGSEYEPWCEDMYAARGQIGLLVEDNSMHSGKVYDQDCEGTISTII